MKTEHRTAACSPTSSILVRLFCPPLHMQAHIYVCRFSLRRRPQCMCVWAYSRCSGRGLSAILIGFVPLFHTQFSCVCDNTQKGAASHFAAQCAGFQYALYQICIYSAWENCCAKYPICPACASVLAGERHKNDGVADRSAHIAALSAYLKSLTRVIKV